MNHANAFPTVLMPVSGDHADATAVAVAAALGGSRPTHLVGLHAKPIPVVISGDMMPGGGYVLQLQEAYDARAQRARVQFEELCRRHGVVGEWRCEDGETDDVLPLHARFADLTVVAADPEYGLDSDAVAAAAFASGRPVLVLPAGCDRLDGTPHVAIAWNSSREAARAVSDALPLLRAARRVDVLTVATDVADALPPGADLSAWLARHDISVDMRTVESGDDSDADSLLEEVSGMAPDLLVMGLYGHSRLRELVLGGASRAMLRQLPVPLFVAH